MVQVKGENSEAPSALTEEVSVAFPETQTVAHLIFQSKTQLLETTAATERVRTSSKDWSFFRFFNGCDFKP